MLATRQLSRAMAIARPDASLQVVFGKAFLVHLHRGDLETAKLFARAFLLRTPCLANGAPITLPGAA